MYSEFSTKAIELIRKYGLRHSYKEKMGIQADIQDELIKLVKTWIPSAKIGKKKILLVVEDIDRCSEEKVIQNIDALRVLLEDDEISKRLVIITAIDERILKNAVRIKYSSLFQSVLNDVPSDEKKSQYDNLIAEYLDKVFISAVKLGNLTIRQKQEFLDELFKDEIDAKTIVEGIKNENKIAIKERLMTSIKSEKIVNNLIDQDGFVDDRIAVSGSDDVLEQPGEKYDFAIDKEWPIDRDIPLEDSKGNVVYRDQLEKRVNERIENQKKLSKLTYEEVKMLQDVIKRWSDTTPRKIRIFYYRYLLAKNLLIKRYSDLNRMNVWQDRTGVEILMAEILKYTELHDPTQIESVRLSLANSGNSRQNIGSYSIFTEDYFYLCEILELVIAY